jgi:mannose-6-phosphate isomerase-like protein (cupin superfamily)
MMRVVPPGGGEIVGDSAERRVEILSDRDPLHATWSRFAPGRAGADPHVHHEHADLFYVLAGELTVMLGPPPLSTDGITITENGSLADALYVFDGTWIDDPDELPGTAI